jgi:protein-S-isoprenylcysteine O-methyltransferase Ste14/membrane-associated phospholipid phosphatase
MKPSLLAKFLYGLLFTVFFPAGLIAWARATLGLVTVPLAAALPLGLTLCGLGAILLLSGWYALGAYGGGLPMNIAPPPRMVSGGIYRLLAHPIYAGFCLLCAGTAISTGSASGLWLVTPFVILGCAALVLGYERPDLQARFGAGYAERFSFLPPDRAIDAQFRDRLRCYLLVLLPWIILYEAVIALGIPSDAVSSFLPFESRIPVVEWTEVFYASTYLWVLLAPLAARTQRRLREFCLAGCVAMAIVFPLFLAIPLIASPRPFIPHTILGGLLLWERGLDSSAAAFPSFHVIWAFLAVRAYEERWPSLRWLWRGWTALISLACLTTGMHSIVDVVGGILVAALCIHVQEAWHAIRRGTEAIANSWREWRLGPLRVINHGIYAGVGASSLLIIVGYLAGPGTGNILALTGAVSLLGAGLWAQGIEGSPRLLRPFGFYGGLLAATLVIALAPLFGLSFWLVAAAFSVGAPWGQGIGRLRCLVQGCCHGSTAPDSVGIRYTQARSRVCQLAELRGVPLHPAPLYSILANGYIALLTARMWILGMPLHLICGVYFLLSGLGRFVEEAYRGEPQTPIVGGLRLYQWIALAVAVAGALITALGRSGPAPHPQFNGPSLLIALGFGLVWWFALGVDFPDSNRRFARLA